MSNIIKSKKKMISIAIISTLSDCYCYGAQTIDITSGTDNNSPAGQYESISVTGGALSINGNTSDETDVVNSSPKTNNGLVHVVGATSKLTINSGLKVDLNAPYTALSSGIFVRQGGNISVEGDTNITIGPDSTGVQSVNGIVVSGEGSTAEFKGKINIKNNAAQNIGGIYYRSGIHVNYGGKVDTLGDINITSLNNGNERGAGLFVGYGNNDESGVIWGLPDLDRNTPTSHFTMNSTKKLTINIAGHYSGGVLTNGHAKVDLGEVEITTNGDLYSFGMQAGNHSNITFSGGIITTNGKEKSHAIIADSDKFMDNNYRSTITATGFVTATTNGDTSNAVQASNYADINFTKGAKLTTTSTNANAIDIENHSSVKVGEKLAINTQDERSYGLSLKGDDALFDGSQITEGKINTFDSAIKFYSVNTTGASAKFNNTTINSTGNNAAIVVTGNGYQPVTSQLDLANSSISASASHKLLNIDSDALTTFVLNADHSELNGYTTVAGNSSFNLNLQNNSTWNIAGNSQVTNLHITNNSLVDFSKQNSPDSYATLTINNDLTGAGLFKMKVNLDPDPAKRKSDKILVTGNASGDHKIEVVNNASQSTNGLGRIDLVEIRQADHSTFTGSYNEQGGYIYNITKRNNNIWELRGTNRLTSSASAAMNFQNSTYLLSYVDTQTLMQRMGEIHNTPEHEGNFWLRSFGGKLNSFSGSRVEGFNMNYYGLQMGADKLLVDNATGRFYTGAMLGYTKGDPDYKAGSGTVKDYNAGLYGTYITNSGFYIDTLLKYMHARNKFNVKDTAGQSVSGTANSDGYGASLEVGKKFHLHSPFYVEPQMQVAYHYQKAAKTHATNGLNVKLASYESILGRAGTLVGYDWQVDNQAVNTYLKVGYVRELSGNTSYYLNKNKEKHDFGGGWVETGLGVSANFKRHNIYGEVSYANGNRFDKQQVNLGYRYQF